MEEIGKIIEQKRAISKKEVGKIYQAHGARGFELAFDILLGKNILKKVEISEAISETRAPMEMGKQPEKGTPVVSKVQTTQKEAITQQEAAKEESYKFRDRSEFYRSISMYSPVERGAMEAVGKVIERKGAITKSEFREILNSHRMGFWAENRLGVLLRNHDLIKVKKEFPAKEVQEVRIPEVTELPPKEVFRQLGKKELGEKLSDLFEMMKEKEIDVGFSVDGTEVRVFGFRARKGIVLRGEAFIEIAGNNAHIRVDKGFANTLLKNEAIKPIAPEQSQLSMLREGRGGVDKDPVYAPLLNVLKPDVQKKLCENKELANFLSVLNFLKSQKIASDIFIQEHTEEKLVSEVKGKYELALRVKTLENEGWEPRDAVKKVLNETRERGRLLHQLEANGFSDEATVLRGLMKPKSANLDALISTLSLQAPAGPGDLGFILSDYDISEVKKAVREAVVEKETEVAKKSKEVEDIRVKARNAMGAWEQYWELGLAEELSLLGDASKGLKNLKRVNEILEKYGESIKELPPETIRPGGEPIARKVEPPPQAKELPEIEKRIEPVPVQEVEKSILEIAAREGLSEDKIGRLMGKCSPAKAEKIIEICKNHHFDWKEHQSVFKCGLKALEPNLSLCDYNNADPAQLGLVYDLRFDGEYFKSRLKFKMSERGLKFRELQEQPALKTETPTAPQEKVEKAVVYHGWPKGKSHFTHQQIEQRRKEITNFCKEKGIDIEHHPHLYEKRLENIKAIVLKAEEKKIPFTPYRRFLTFTSKSFNKSVQSVEWYNSQVLEESKIDLAEHSGILVFPPGNLSENLKTCVENKRDVIGESLIWHLDMEPEKFKEFLKSYVPPEHLTPEEKEKRVIALLVEKGMKEEDIWDSTKKKSPKTVKEILEACEGMYDCTTHQQIFAYGPATVKWKMGLCSCNEINPSEISVVKLGQSKEKFEEFIKSKVTQEGREFKELPQKADVKAEAPEQTKKI